MALFISIQKVKDEGFIQGNVEDKLIKPIIKRVQKSFLKPIIGCKLYDELDTAIENDTLTTIQTNLLSGVISDFLISCIDYRAVNATTYQLRSKGVGKQDSEYHQPIIESEGGVIRTDLKNDMDTFKIELIRYLIANDIEFGNSCEAGCEWYNHKLEMKNNTYINTISF